MFYGLVGFLGLVKKLRWFTIFATIVFFAIQSQNKYVVHWTLCEESGQYVAVITDGWTEANWENVEGGVDGFVSDVCNVFQK